MRYLYLFEDFNPGDDMLSHLSGRGIDHTKTRYILDEDSIFLCSLCFLTESFLISSI